MVQELHDYTDNIFNSPIVILFGEYIHHYPYLGLFGDEDKQNLTIAFNHTLKLYRNTFNEELPQYTSSQCDNDGGGESTCAGRCTRD